MHRKVKALLAAALIVIALLTAGCSKSTKHVDATKATVIDVRTPAEFDQGHLQGAINIDFSGDFATQIGARPKDGHYLLYCRSGARAGQALDLMKQQGFTDVTNLGGIDAAAKSTGLSIVKS